MNALVINGKLNQTIFEESTKTLSNKDYDFAKTVIENGYDIRQEIQKWLNADFILLHFPINWFGMPFKTKAYLNTVLMSGYGKIYEEKNFTTISATARIDRTLKEI